MKNSKLARISAALVVFGLATTSCSSNSGSAGTTDAASLTITNCNQQVSYPGTINKIFANDASMIGSLLSIGAGKELVGVSGLNHNRAAFESHYGADVLTGVEEVGSSMPSMETIIAKGPQLVAAGWNYGFIQGAGVNPDKLKSNGIDSYVLTASCLQQDGQKARGIMDPWAALNEDIANLGKITGHTDKAQQVLDDLKARKEKLENAPQAEKRPNVLLFDSASKQVLSSGNLGEPQAIINTAGGRNVMDDVADTWTNVSWERIAETNPDVIAFNDYGEQSFAEKVALLEASDAAKNTPAVKNKRYLNLSYAMWVGNPLNMDAAEQLR